MRKKWLAVISLVGATIVGATIVGWPLASNSVSRMRQALLLKQTQNDLKWIAIALHDFHDRHGHFPPVAVRNEEGVPIHSWRSLIHHELKTIADTKDQFDSYDLSQPWDSPANRESASRHRFGTHPYQILAIVGSGASWHPTEERSMSDIKDGLRNTILLIAVRDSEIAWHQPVDAVVTEAGSLTVNDKELDISSDVFVVTVDGTVRYLPDGISSSTLSALITINADDTPLYW